MHTYMHKCCDDEQKMVSAKSSYIGCKKSMK